VTSSLTSFAPSTRYSVLGTKYQVLPEQSEGNDGF